MSGAMMIVTSATVAFQSTCPTHGQSTHHHSCLPRALYMASMALNLVFTSSPIDVPPTPLADLHTNSSHKPSSSSLSRRPNQPTCIPQIPSTVARPTFLPPTVVPSPAMLSHLPTTRLMRMTNQIRPARCQAHLASPTPPLKCLPNSPTTAGRLNGCRLMSDRTRKMLTESKVGEVSRYHFCG